MTALTPESVVFLPRGVRLRFDEARGAKVLLAPERVFDLDAVAAAVLGEIDGERPIRAIAEDLAQRFGADRAVVEADILEMLSGLVAKRVVEATEVEAQVAEAEVAKTKEREP